MTRGRINILFVLLAAAGIVAVARWGPAGLYSFGGHGPLLNDLQRAVLIALTLTHAALALILWTQRRRWEHADASTFRFVSAKAVFWGYFSVAFVQRPGILLTTMYLLMVLMVTTIDLDVQLLRRYVLCARNDADSAA